MTAEELVARRARSATLVHVLRSRPSLTDNDRAFLNVLVGQDGKISNNQLRQLNEMAEKYQVTYDEQ